MNRNDIKSISLTNYDPSIKAIPDCMMGREATGLKNEIIALCDKFGLSYIEKNKALYSADRELYFRTLNNT